MSKIHNLRISEEAHDAWPYKVPGDVIFPGRPAVPQAHRARIAMPRTTTLRTAMPRTTTLRTAVPVPLGHVGSAVLGVLIDEAQSVRL